MTTVLLAGRYWREHEALLNQCLATAPELRFWVPDDGQPALEAGLRQVDMLLMSAEVALDGRIFELLPRCPNVRTIQLPFSGHDRLRPELLPPGSRLCITSVHDATIAEFVFAAMLELEIGLAMIADTFRAGSWAYGGSTAMGHKHGELRGKRLGLLGFGSIGRAVARRAAAFEMEIAAVGRSAQPSPPAPLAWYGGPEALPRLLSQSDYLVVCCALTDETLGLVGAAELAAMPPHAALVNVARGPVVDEEALNEALRDRVIRTAALDVWYAYPSRDEPQPRPSRFPFHMLDNVLMTPHCAAWTVTQDARRIEAVAANVDRVTRGDEPLNVVLRVGADPAHPSHP